MQCLDDFLIFLCVFSVLFPVKIKIDSFEDGPHTQWHYKLTDGQHGRVVAVNNCGEGMKVGGGDVNDPR